MAFKMKGSPAKMGTIKGTDAHRSALRQVEEEKSTNESSLTRGPSGQRAYQKSQILRPHHKKESKFQYDVRMRKETRKAAKTEEKTEKGVLEQQIIDKSDLTEKERLALGENIIPGAPDISTAEVIPNTYGTFSGDDWNKVDEVSGLNLHQLVNKRDELALAGNTESYEYSKAQEAINIANAGKTQTWGGKVETEEEKVSKDPTLGEYLKATAETLNKQNPNITAKEMTDSLRYYKKLYQSRMELMR